MSTPVLKTQIRMWEQETNSETAQLRVWSREMAINSVNEGKHVMTGPQSHWWGWWMAFHSNTWQFITHSRRKHTHNFSEHISASHTHSHSLSFSPLLTFCTSTYALQCCSALYCWHRNHIYGLGKHSWIHHDHTHIHTYIQVRAVSISHRCPITYPH